MVDMRKALLSGVALMTIFGGSALAADMPRAYKAPPPVQPQYSWTGFYLGTHTGVAAGRTQTSNVAPFGGFDAGVPLTYDVNPVGIFGGGQIGYNWQMSQFVFGVEIDGGYLGARSRTRQADDLIEVRYGAYGTFTGRAGLAFDRLLSYVKGGAVVANIRNTASDIDGGLIDPTDFSETSKARWGWTIGTGFEYAIAPSWTVKSEYLYMDFSNERSTNLDGDRFEHKNQMHTWKVGLNYKWGAPITAAY
jgi:outer membrane immunogenic protein